MSMSRAEHLGRIVLALIAVVVACVTMMVALVAVVSLVGEMAPLVGVLAPLVLGVSTESSKGEGPTLREWVAYWTLLPVVSLTLLLSFACGWVALFGDGVMPAETYRFRYRSECDDW